MNLLAPEQAGKGSPQHVLEDFRAVIVPALQDHDVDVLLFWGESQRLEPGRMGVVFDPLLNHRDVAHNTSKDYLEQKPYEIGWQYDERTTEFVGVQVWRDRPAASLGCDNYIRMADGLTYHFIPMATDRDRVYLNVPKTRRYLYFASQDSEKQWIRQRLRQIFPEADHIYAKYTEPSRAVLEKVARYEVVFAAGYCAVQALAMGCRVVWTARRLYGGLNSSNLEHARNNGFTWNNWTESLRQDVERLQREHVLQAINETEVFDPEQFFLQTYIPRWQEVCAT